MNFAELYSAISSTLENEEATFLASIPRFVQQTEERVFTDVLFPAMLRTSTGACTLGEEYVECPTDLVAISRLSVTLPDGRRIGLLPKDRSYLEEAYPVGGTTGTPRYYALVGDPAAVSDTLTLALAPTPAAAYPLTLTYYHFPDSIVQGVLQSVTIPSAGSGYANGTYYNVEVRQPLTGAAGRATIVVSGGGVTGATVSYGGAFFTAAAPIELTAGALQVGGVGSGASLMPSQVGNTDGRSWLGDTYSPVLFAGAVYEGAVFLKLGEDQLKTYKERYDSALKTAVTLGKGVMRVDANRP